MIARPRPLSSHPAQDTASLRWRKTTQGVRGLCSYNDHGPVLSKAPRKREKDAWRRVYGSPLLEPEPQLELEPEP